MFVCYQMSTSKEQSSIINESILGRCLSHIPLPKYNRNGVVFNPRPISEKYHTTNFPQYRQQESTARSGYAASIQVESNLQNREFALQRCDQSVYVPSSTSSLYLKRNNDSNSNSKLLPNSSSFLFNNDTRGERRGD